MIHNLTIHLHKWNQHLTNIFYKNIYKKSEIFLTELLDYS